MTLTPIDLLALYLLYRRDQMPAYIDSLPKSFDCPLAWYADEVQVLIHVFLIDVQIYNVSQYSRCRYKQKFSRWRHGRIVRR